jgi:NAD(P)-dependent dehydrogenase (short-subunit alcohol dehydrogenase family)
MRQGNIVLITGASRGFGAAAARLIASRGNTVVATMRSPEKDGAAVQEGLGEWVHLERLDVTDGASVRAVVGSVLERFGRIDVLINNAGYGLFGPVEEASEAELWRELDTNLLGQWRLLQAVLPSMRRRGAGKIVNVSSLAGRVPSPFLGLYAASKHAVEAMSEALRFEVAKSGVQVTILEPGMFASDWQTTSLDVARSMRDGRSSYPLSETALAAFQAQAATRPSSRSVAVAMADVAGLEQHLPMRWPVGNDAIQVIPLRRTSTDDEWRFLWRSGALGDFRRWLRESLPTTPRSQRHDWSRDNVVLITGASRGFGEAAARECAERGNTVVATMRNPERDGSRVRGGLEDRIYTLQLDVTDTASVRRAVDETMARFGRVDVLINNAGYGLYGPVEELVADAFLRLHDLAAVLRLLVPADQLRADRQVPVLDCHSW